MKEIETSKILVIDDDKSNLVIASELLRPIAQIVLANNGSQGIEKAKRYLPDLILLDLIMPNLDGYAVLDFLKASPTTHHIPVILITSNSSQEVQQKGLQLGACDYLQKPLNPDITVARVKTYLEITRQRNLLESQYANTETSGNNLKIGH